MPYTSQMGLPWAPQSDTSHEAAIAAEAFAATQEARVLAFVTARGAYGSTMKEAEMEMPIQRSSACGRFFALVAAGKLRKTTERREGCAVYQVVSQ